MTTKIGFVMDPIESINPKKDSTLAMMRAADKKGWKMFYMEQKDIFTRNGKAYGLVQELTLCENKQDWYQLSEKFKITLAELHVIMMRKDPPFDNEYIYSTYILELAENQGSLIVNKPQSLRDANEKLYTALFPQCCPETLVTRSETLFREFLAEHKDIIFKPLDGMGGTSIFRVRHDDPNIGVIIETLTDYGQQLAMAQKFIPEITEGDKRILVINGKPVPFALARIPAKGETRGNLAAGGRGVSVPLSEKDYWIVEQVAATLVKKGLIFVGLDVIGDYLTEINVTSPTCIQELDMANDLDIAGQLMDCIETKL
ncbi:MAG: glutathione synthase [Gammaproteobacteria bacterium]|nr:MAG: glutathione synthase [Gammaproteobacteria bacterium]